MTCVSSAWGTPHSCQVTGQYIGDCPSPSPTSGSAWRTAPRPAVWTASPRWSSRRAYRTWWSAAPAGARTCPGRWREGRYSWSSQTWETARRSSYPAQALQSISTWQRRLQMHLYSRWQLKYYGRMSHTVGSSVYIYNLHLLHCIILYLNPALKLSWLPLASKGEIINAACRLYCVYTQWGRYFILQQGETETRIFRWDILLNTR